MARVWNPADFPYGSEGEQEAITLVGVSGRGFPGLMILRKIDSEMTIYEVQEWSFFRAEEKHALYDIKSTPFDNPKYNGMINEYSYLSFSSLLGEKEIVCKDWCFIENSNGWIVSLCSHSSDWKLLDPVFKKIILSFNVNI